jgi:septal ring factor EnvC (AmiA/AmiB activator)
MKVNIKLFNLNYNDKNNSILFEANKQGIIETQSEKHNFIQQQNPQQNCQQHNYQQEIQQLKSQIDSQKLELDQIKNNILLKTINHINRIEQHLDQNYMQLQHLQHQMLQLHQQQQEFMQSKGLIPTEQQLDASANAP